MFVNQCFLRLKKMKIAALLLTAVVVLNSVDISLQGNIHASKCFGPSGRNQSPSPSPPPSPPPRREPSPRRPRHPNLPNGSLIIRGFLFPQRMYYRVGHNDFREMLIHYEAVLNYEGKVVAVFLNVWDNELYGIYHGIGGYRAKLNPACCNRGQEHVDFLDEAGCEYYPEFRPFEKPERIIISSPEAYERLERGLSCGHTDQALHWHSDLPQEAHIVRNVKFPQGFFFKINPDEDLYHPFALHECDVVVDKFKMIVAAFLAPSEYRLYGIYLQEGGHRVKLTDVSMEQHIQLTPAESELYTEFVVYKKPAKKFRNSVEECG